MLNYFCIRITGCSSKLRIDETSFRVTDSFTQCAEPRIYKLLGDRFLKIFNDLPVFKTIRSILPLQQSFSKIVNSENEE